jgi:hypothetical protein
MTSHTYNQSQSLWGDVIDAEHTPHLRASVRRNAYDEQSHSRVEAWTEHGWKEVYDEPITATAVSAFSYHSRDGAWEATMLTDLERLLDIGRSFFATKENDMTTYHITRFRFEGDNEVLVRGLTLEQAQEHCQREDTHGDGWFDGYDED